MGDVMDYESLMDIWASQIKAQDATPKPSWCAVWDYKHSRWMDARQPARDWAWQEEMRRG